MGGNGHTGGNSLTPGGSPCFSCSMPGAAFNPRTLALPKAERVQIAKHAAAVRWGRERRRFSRRLLHVDQAGLKAAYVLGYLIGRLAEPEASKVYRAFQRLLRIYVARADLLNRKLPPEWRELFGATIQELRRKAEEEH